MPIRCLYCLTFHSCPQVLQRYFVTVASPSSFATLRGLGLLTLISDFRAERDTDLLRSLTALESINDQLVAAFWKQAGGKESEP